MNHFFKIGSITFIIFLFLGITVSQAQPYPNNWNQLSLDVSPYPLGLRVGYYGDIQIWRNGNTDGQLYHSTRGGNGT